MKRKIHELTEILKTREPGLYHGPYLEALIRIMDEAKHNGLGLCEALLEHRFDLVSTYCFPIPHHGLLGKILPHGPFVEMGAGSGYLARALVRSGASVSAYDKYPPDETPAFGFFSQNGWYDDTWFNVVEAGPEEAAAHSDATLLLCWPPPDDPMALDSLTAYQDAGGEKLIYIGDPLSSGDAAFHGRLKGFSVLVDEPTVTWPGIGEKLMILEVGRG